MDSHWGSSGVRHREWIAGRFQEAPGPFAPVLLERPCQRCGYSIPTEANFCPNCGFAQSTRATRGQSYQHPEKLLPGPPLHHENGVNLGNGLNGFQRPDTTSLPPAPPQTIAPNQNQEAPRSGIKSMCRSMKNQRYCPPGPPGPPSTLGRLPNGPLGPLGPVCG